MTAEPSFRELADWIDGRLTSDRAAAVAAYVATTGGETAETVAWLRDFKEAAGLLPLQAPPPETSEAARAAFRRLRTPGDADPRWFDVTFDSRLAPLAGVRSTSSASTSFHLDLDGHGLAISVDLTRVDVTDLEIDGSVRPTDDASVDGAGAIAVVLASEGRELSTIPVDRWGHFAGRVPADVDELRVIAGPQVLRADLTEPGDT